MIVKFATSILLLVLGFSSGHLALAQPVASGYTVAKFGMVSAPRGLAFSAAGDLYVLGRDNGTITKFTPTGQQSTCADLPDSGLGYVGPQFRPGTDTLLVSEYAVGDRVLSVACGGVPSVVATNITSAHGQAFDALGNLYVSNYDETRVFKIVNGVGVAFASGLNRPDPITFAPSGHAFSGHLFVGDRGSRRIMRVPPSGGVAVECVSSGIGEVLAMAFEATTLTLFIADFTNGKVFAVSQSCALNQQPVATGFARPDGLAFDQAGNLFVAEESGALWKLTKAPTTTTTTTTTITTTTSTTMLASTTTTSTTTTSTTTTSTTTTITTTTKTTMPTSTTTTSTTTTTMPSLDCGTAVVAPSEIAPSNHRFVDISVSGVTDAAGVSAKIAIDEITQDEELDGLGDGDTCPDAEAVSESSARVRAERGGRGTGRVYRIHFTATAADGQECQGMVTTCVPHDQRPGRSCLDEEQEIDSTGSCEPPSVSLDAVRPAGKAGGPTMLVTCRSPSGGLAAGIRCEAVGLDADSGSVYTRTVQKKFGRSGQARVRLRLNEAGRAELIARGEVSLVVEARVIQPSGAVVGEPTARTIMLHRGR